MIKRIKKYLIFFLIIFSTGIVAGVFLVNYASKFKENIKGCNGIVARVKDGDSIMVSCGPCPAFVVRLKSIDCPERDQPFGREATELTKKLCEGETVKLIGDDYDDYGRVLAEVILPDGRNLNQELVKSGLAWWFRQYAPNEGSLKNLEKEARREKRGLWDGDHPIAPWDWRKGVRP